MRYLSPEWFRAAADAVATLSAPPDAGPVVIAQRVTDGPDGDVDYRLVVTDDGCRLVPGTEPAADVTLTVPYDLATAIATGDASASDAFLGGDLTLTGDPRALVRHAGVAADLAAVLGALSAD